MGCNPSKQSVCRSCNAQCSPLRRSYSSFRRRSPPHEDDNHHVVGLTSTTLGYLLLDPSTKHDHERKDPVVAGFVREGVRQNAAEKKNKDFAVGVIEADTWSKLIDEKIGKVVPKTPVRTPPGEPEAINAWELMEGLDDSSPFHPPYMVDHTRCARVLTDCNSTPLDQATLLSQEKDRDLDPNTMKITPLINDEGAKKSLDNGEKAFASRTKEKLVLYFTSLRGVRKTYEDCCHVRAILKNCGVQVDERDVSMHSGFKDELKELLGDRYGGGGLPKVFVGRKYIGGADEIRRFHDEFQLDKVLEGCEMAVDGGGGGDGDGCAGCGDIRFLPCDTCSGSCKIYYEVNSDEGEKEEVKEESDFGFQRCPDCNENGLIRCPICCD